MFVQRDIAFPKQNYGRSSIQNLLSSVVIKVNKCDFIRNSDDMKQVHQGHSKRLLTFSD